MDLLTFGLFLAWAVHESRRPQWHKRLMTFAMFLSLDAAIQRYVWIPMDYCFGPFALVLDSVLLVPLIVYDLRTLHGRLHPATVRGTALLLGSEAILFALWGTAFGTGSCPQWRTRSMARPEFDELSKPEADDCREQDQESQCEKPVSITLISFVACGEASMG